MNLAETAFLSRQAEGFDLRWFTPTVEVAHCCLGPFWRGHLGKNELVGYQASGRGGVVRVRAQGQRVILGGNAVTVLRGELV